MPGNNLINLFEQGAKKTLVSKYQITYISPNRFSKMLKNQFETTVEFSKTKNQSRPDTLKIVVGPEVTKVPANR